MQKFFLKFKFFCLSFFASMSVVLIILLFHQKLVSSDAVKMSYPEVVFVNKISIDEGIALSSLRDLIVPFMKNEKLLDVDIQAVFDEIKGFNWVEDVAVIRNFPDTLKILIKSKNIIAYKVLGDMYFPVSDKGEVLEMPVDYDGGLLVFGDYAEDKLPLLLDFLKKYPDILRRVVGVQFVNGLRWNLLLYSLEEDGILVKLDDAYENGIKKLAELDLQNGILSKDVSEIDLRDLDKILVKQRRKYGA